MERQVRLQRDVLYTYFYHLVTESPISHPQMVRRVKPLGSNLRVYTVGNPLYPLLSKMDLEQHKETGWGPGTLQGPIMKQRL